MTHGQIVDFSGPGARFHHGDSFASEVFADLLAAIDPTMGQKRLPKKPTLDLPCWIDHAESVMGEQWAAKL